MTFPSFFASPPMSSYALSLLFSLAAMILGLAIGGYAILLSHRRQKLWHETARLALEKGQPMPPLSAEAGMAAANPADVDTLTWERLRSEQRARNDVRWGLILGGLGLGIVIFMKSVDAPQARFVGAIPGFVGLAMLINGLLPRRTR